MKKLLHPVVITLMVVVLIFSLPFFIKKATPVLTDAQLRERALSTTLKPVPKTYDELLKVVDNPENPMSKEKIALGKALFFDTILSQDRTINCASCHILEEGGDDNLPTAIGFQGQANPSHLNSPTVLNAALAKRQFWDGRARDLKEQVLGPVSNPVEMGFSMQRVIEVLQKDPAYYGWMMNADFPQYTKHILTKIQFWHPKNGKTNM